MEDQNKNNNKNFLNINLFQGVKYNQTSNKFFRAKLKKIDEKSEQLFNYHKLLKNAFSGYYDVKKKKSLSENSEKNPKEKTKVLTEVININNYKYNQDGKNKIDTDNFDFRKNDLNILRDILYKLETRKKVVFIPKKINKKTTYQNSFLHLNSEENFTHILKLKSKHHPKNKNLLFSNNLGRYTDSNNTSENSKYKTITNNFNHSLFKNYTNFNSLNKDSSRAKKIKKNVSDSNSKIMRHTNEIFREIIKNANKGENISIETRKKIREMNNKYGKTKYLLFNNKNKSIQLREEGVNSSKLITNISSIKNIKDIDKNLFPKNLMINLRDLIYKKAKNKKYS